MDSKESYTPREIGEFCERYATMRELSILLELNPSKIMKHVYLLGIKFSLESIAENVPTNIRELFSAVIESIERKYSEEIRNI